MVSDVDILSGFQYAAGTFGGVFDDSAARMEMYDIMLTVLLKTCCAVLFRRDKMNL